MPFHRRISTRTAAERLPVYRKKSAITMNIAGPVGASCLSANPCAFSIIHKILQYKINLNLRLFPELPLDKIRAAETA